MAQVIQAMLRVKSECGHSTPQCLSALVESRHQIWPHVVAEIGPGFTEYPPSGFFGDFARASLTATGCDGKSVAFVHVWKAAGWGVIENFRKITSNFYWGADFEHGCADWGSPTTFTFVREPLERFVSGYAQMESYWENNAKGLGNPFFATVKGQRGTAARAEEFLREFFRSGVNWTAISGLNLRLGGL